MIYFISTINAINAIQRNEYRPDDNHISTIRWKKFLWLPPIINLHLLTDRNAHIHVTEFYIIVVLHFIYSIFHTKLFTFWAFSHCFSITIHYSSVFVPHLSKIEIKIHILSFPEALRNFKVISVVFLSKFGGLHIFLFEK